MSWILAGWIYLAGMAWLSLLADGEEEQPPFWVYLVWPILTTAAVLARSYEGYRD